MRKRPERSGWTATLGDITLGLFQTEELAALARDRVARGMGIDRAWWNFPRRELEPATVEQIRLEARAGRKAKTSSRYVGVAWNSKEKMWRATIRDGARTLLLGSFDDEETAAKRYDVAAFKLKSDKARLNFGIPRGKVKFEIPEPQSKTSKYLGVQRRPNGWFQAATIDKGAYIPLGKWKSEREAAIAFDRGALYLRGPQAKLNLPAKSQGLGPRSPEELVRDALFASRAHRKMRSKYFGVIRNAERKRWDAHFGVDYTSLYIGCFRTEREAAIAHDRVWLHMRGSTRKLNFPNMVLEPASVEQVREEQWRNFKVTTTSQYRGVHWSRQAQCWIAQITVEDAQIRLGKFDHEEEAAVAYDDAAKKHHGARARLNFPL